MAEKKQKATAGKLVCHLVAVVILACLGLTGEIAQASSMNLVLQPTPDIFSDAIDVSYDAAAQKLVARGFAEYIKNGGEIPVSIVNGEMEISAEISNGGEALSGTLTITGEVPSLGIGQGPLLIGKLESVGGNGGGVAEFTFSTDGGSLAFQFGPSINVILGQSGFAGTFAENFSNGAIGVAGIGW